ncbi:MAG: efflux RND transporter periplasmic adaptor subunit [Planctomycetes bacterium]|nr:efflux RND transporter periplasmic adaptor subunit [Planctomycetota bacterium]
MSRLALVLGLALAACSPTAASKTPGTRAHGVVVAKVLQLGAGAPTRVERVLVTAGAKVERDTPLIQFDTAWLAARRASAAAEVARATAELARLEKGTRPEELRDLRARCDELAARLKTATDAEKPVLEAEFAGAEARFGLASKGARKEELDAARATVLAAQARQKELALEAEELRAPMPGLVHHVAIEPGASVAAHEVLVTLRDPARLFVEADLAPLGPGWQTGATVWITSSLLSGQRFEGRVLELTVPTPTTEPAREAVRPTFVRARIEALDGRDLLPPGSTVELDLAP